MLRGRTCRLPVAAPCLRPGRFSSSCLKTSFVQVSRSDRDIFVSVVIHVSGVGLRRQQHDFSCLENEAYGKPTLVI